jgi:hypothetical protein
MSNQTQAEAVFARLEHQLKNHPLVSGIELAALQVNGVYTDDLCVRVLVKSAAVTHETLGIPTDIDGIAVEVRFSVIELH